MKKTFAIFALVAAALPLFGGEKVKMKIASFNIGFCRMASDIPVWEGRRGHIMPLVEWHGFDIVGMQEPFSFQIDYLLKASDEYAAAGEIARDLSYADIPSFSPRGRENVDRMCRNMNNPIFYKRTRFELLDSGKFYFSDTPDRAERGFGGGFDSIRSCVWAKFREKKRGREFFFFNLHLCVEKFIEQHKPAAELLIKKVREIAGESTFFITGDFNEEKGCPAYKVIAASGIAKDAREVAASVYGSRKCTFNGYTLLPKKGSPIDFIYVSPSVEVLRFATIQEHVDETAISDHFPIAAVVRF